MTKKQKLELTWIGKENRPRLEPRALLEDPEKSYHAAHQVKTVPKKAAKGRQVPDLFDNRLIFGDNLLADEQREFGQKKRATLSDHPIAIARSYFMNRLARPQRQGISLFEPAVEWVRRNHPQIKITVYIPALDDERHQRRNDNYHRMGVTCRTLPLADISRHVFPATVRVNEIETVTRPAEWV